MKTAETRITYLLIAAIGLVVGVAYWQEGNGGTRLDEFSQWNLLRGGLLVTGACVCIAIGIGAIRQDLRAARRRALDHARQWILAPGIGGNGALPIPRDPELQPFITPLRERIEQLSAKAEALQVQKKNLEIQLRLADSQRRQSETMIHGISDAVIVTDAFDELLLANPAAAAVFNFNPEKAVRRPVSQILGEKTGGRLAADITELRQSPTRASRRTSEYQLEVDGQMRTFSVTLSCVMDNTDQLSGIVTVLHDRTREDEISKLKTEFVSHVSHELRTPLSSIKAYAELLVDGEAADEKARMEFYNIIQAEAERLSRLIDNILNISRIESGMMKINKKPVSLNGILKRVMEVAMPQAREKKITLMDKISPIFFMSEADQDMIYQASLNLVSNAIKYTKDGGRVEIALEADEEKNELVVLVTDTGVGIPQESMKHLFEKFFRVEKNKGMARGSGLGLNLTRQIIEAIHRGRMIVRSEEGKGSTFGFALPIAA
jgi:two-component system phosphate regulon sensor histidine kinase PhoR